MNEADPNVDYEAAVIQLRSGNFKSLFKFCSVVVLLLTVATIIVCVVGSVSGWVSKATGV